MLFDFGITSFTLKVYNKSYYKIVRENDENAASTISEGEKTFISFLYFYHKVNGGDSPENINNDKILVIDDPISSLDSNYLFIVQQLINNLYEKVLNTSNENKQLFILSHNSYFYKYIADYFKNYDKYRLKVSYYIVRKIEKISIIEYTDTNPIKSTYDLLWQELKKDNLDSVNMQNCMRRLLEFYAEQFGFDKIENIKSKFEGDKIIIVHSLIKYLHSGSHNIKDDLYFPVGDNSTPLYLEVFKEIFYELGLKELFDKKMLKL